MRSSLCKAACLLALVTQLGSAHAQSPATVSDAIESHLATGKNAAGGRDNTPDFYGLVIAGLNGGPPLSFGGACVISLGSAG
jgi:hypothetical protein